MPEAAAHFGLPVGLTVAQGGSDAEVAMIGQAEMRGGLGHQPAHHLAEGQHLRGPLVGELRDTGLMPEAAAHFGLPVGLTVAQGGSDAEVAMIGLGDPGSRPGCGRSRLPVPGSASGSPRW
jgi:sugar (pentulose or hexulose) kinase